MRIRVLDRVLVAIAGLLLIVICVGVIGQVFFGKDVAGTVVKWITPESTAAKILVGICAAILLGLGVYCLLILFRHRSKKDKFILQKLESGDLAISLNTLESMVQKCLDQHDEIETENILLENQRDGLLIRIRGTVAGGISIPLTVDTLQKQVKQYVTACSGVEVKGIRIQIEASGEDAVNAAFAIEPPVNNLLAKGTETTETTEIPEVISEDPAEIIPEDVPETPSEGEKAASEEVAAAAAMAAAETLMNDLDTEDNRPIHQRLFSTQEEPCIMPLPPENIAPAEEKTEEDSVQAEKTKKTKQPAKRGRPRKTRKSNPAAEKEKTDITEGEENA